MNNDWFFEKFALIADAPGAVERMRGLVLELAVQGRVVEQDNSEGSSLTLLKEIRKKNTASNEEISMEQVEFQSVKVPSSWEICGLGEVAEIVRGVSFPGSAKSDSPRDGHVACLRTASVQSEIDWEDLIYIPQSHVRRMDQWVTKNDIMISMANSYELVGKVAIVRSCPRKASFGAFLAAIRPIVIDPYYLLYVLRSPRMQFAFRASSSQTTNIANISLARIRPLPFPLPPLAEQRRIVAKVDELMGICDALEAQQRERESRKSVLVRASLSRFAESPTPENLGYLFHKSYDIPPSELRKSILTLAVQGKLVSQNPNDEPAATLIKLISRQKESVIYHGIVPKASRLPPIGNDCLPFVVPTSWEWIRLEYICELITKGSSPNWQGVQYVDAENGVLFITSENVGNYVLRKMDEPKYVERKFNEMETRSILHRNDLLVNLVGGSIGRSAVYDLDDIANINQAVGIIRLVRGDTSVDRRYLLHYLNSPISLAIMFEEQVETARANLSLTNMKQFLVPIPPLAEQHRIVAKVDQLMALVDELERQQEATREKATKLLDAIVQEMTSGERGIAATLET